jgi:hypothetical protein
LKRKALSRVAARCGSNVKVKNKYEAVALTLCDKEEGAAFNNSNEPARVVVVITL